MRKLKNEELNRLDLKSFKAASKFPFLIVLDNVRSGHNVGAVFRTADAFLLEGVYLCGITARPPHKDIQKTALGASESVQWKYFETTEKALSELRSQGYRILVAEQAHGSRMLNTFLPETGMKYALIFGHEVDGVSQSAMNMADEVIEIPQFGTKHSLNISVSAGIVIWSLISALTAADIPR